VAFGLSMKFLVDTNKMSLLETQQLLERMANLLRSERRAVLMDFGLQPVQFEVLDYLSQCNRFSDTPMAVTEYLRQTKGTVSQTLKVLEKHQLIFKVPDDMDKRVVHLHLTDKGKALIQSVQPSSILNSLEPLYNPIKIAEINQELKQLLVNLQVENNLKSFGQCKFCQHNLKTSDSEYFCNLTKQALAQEEIELICKEQSVG
jgi:DNA-binding MarR family transcriptional regulator